MTNKKPTRSKSQPTAAKSAAPAATASVTTNAATGTAAAVAAVPDRDRTAITALITKLRHLDADIARDAATTLGTLPANPDSLSALAAVLLNADNFFHPVVRTAAAASLGKLRDPRALNALLHATRDPMAEASDEAVKSLGLLADPAAIPTLRAIIQNTDNFFLPNVRNSAELSLKQLTK